MSKEKQDLWQEYNFFDVIEVLDFRGRTPKKLNLDWGGDIPALSANNVKMGKIDYSLTTNFGSEELYSKWMTKGDLEIGDLVLTTEAPAGNVVVINDNKKYILSQRVIGLKPDKRVIDSNYLMYFFMGNYFKNYLQGYGTGTTVTGISQKNLEFLKIIAPPLEEQQKIAEILSSVDAAIEKTEQVIAKTEEVKKGLMQQLLTKGIGHTEFKQTEIGEIPVEWELIKIQKLLDLGILDSIQDGNHGEKHPTSSDYCDEGIPFIMANDLINGDIDFAKCKKIPKSIADNLRIGFSRENDILLTHKATIGKVAIVPNIKDYVMLTPQVTYYRIKKQENLIPSFLKYYFESSKFQKELEVMSKQSTRSYIGITNQKKLSILLPSIEEQTSIVEILDTIVLKQKKEENKLQQLKIIKNGLMQQLLTGQVRIKID